MQGLVRVGSYASRVQAEMMVELLRNEGIDASRVHAVGNTMIDTLVALEDRFRSRRTAAGLGLEPGGYLLVTLHRPALVDGELLGTAIERVFSSRYLLGFVLVTAVFSHVLEYAMNCCKPHL